MTKSSKILEVNHFFERNYENISSPARYWNLVVFSNETVKIFHVQQKFLFTYGHIWSLFWSLFSPLQVTIIFNWLSWQTCSYFFFIPLKISSLETSYRRLVLW